MLFFPLHTNQCPALPAELMSSKTGVTESTSMPNYKGFHKGGEGNSFLRFLQGAGISFRVTEQIK